MFRSLRESISANSRLDCYPPNLNDLLWSMQNTERTLVKIESVYHILSSVACSRLEMYRLAELTAAQAVRDNEAVMRTN